MRYFLTLFLGFFLIGCGSELTLDKDRLEESLAEVKDLSLEDCREADLETLLSASSGAAQAAPRPSTAS